MSGLTFTYQHQEPAYTPTTNIDPTIVPTIQKTSLANVTTDVSNDPPPQLLTSMQQMQQLLIHMQTNQTVGLGQTSNCNTHTHQAVIEPIQGQPHNLLP